MKCLWSCVWFLFFDCFVLGLGLGDIEVRTMDDGDEYQIGKFDNSDEQFLDTDFDFIEKPYKPKLDSIYNGTHFILNYVGTPKTCISSITVQSYEDDTQKTPTQNPKKKSKIWCQKGGIGKKDCLLIFRMRTKREDARVKIFGVRGPCSFKERYLNKNPRQIDAYGQHYQYSEDYPYWNLPRTNLKQYNRFNEIIYVKDGLFNIQKNYLDESDKLTAVRELFVPDNTLKFVMDFKNSGPKKISFLDIYWYQQSKNSRPIPPYIYYNGQCASSNKTCQVIFDADEPLSYVFVKVFRNEDYDGPRVLARDLGRSGK
uniref:34 kDa salivary protein n=1 Tax=Phlebotomus duboscqi TaxID=37738 RepID=Q06K69_PHLDU|nr:34 kDa salivary protein [Phlebotomus duboscqi]